MYGRRESIIRTCVSLRSDQVDALKAISLDTGAPVAELTRRAIDGFLAGRVAGHEIGRCRPVLVPCGTGSSPSTHP